MGWENPVTWIVIPGVLGGIVIALAIINWPGRDHRALARDAFSTDGPATDVINMARIRVAGVGGLGLVAMAAAVALDIPRIGRSMAAGLILGALGAGIVILRRRRKGPFASI